MSRNRAIHLLDKNTGASNRRSLLLGFRLLMDIMQQVAAPRNLKDCVRKVSGCTVDFPYNRIKRRCIAGIS
eukprot:scaffold2299_cov131-Cylindrotheca_fusiformis.AAC.49